MANTLVNLARVQSTTLGTGTLTLGSAIAGFNTFAAAGLTDGQTVTYAIEDYSSDIPAAVTGREIGQGVYSAGTLTRGTVYSSTSSGAKINCSGKQHVLVTAAAEDLASFATDLTAHLNDTADAHDASAISFSATGGIASTDVQAAIAELDSEKLSTATAASTYQPLDADLTAIAALTSAADKVPYSTGAGAWALADFSAAGRALVDDADADAMRATLAIREKLTANRTYYVRTDGSDSNTGLANTAGGAFLTIQKACDVFRTLDLGIYGVTIQVGSGTYTAGATIAGANVGGSASNVPLTIQGDTVTPSNCIISTTSASCIGATDGAKIYVTGFKLQTTTAGDCLIASRNGEVRYGNIEFGTCAAFHKEANDHGRIYNNGNYSISGGAVAHEHCNNESYILNLSATVTITGTPAFSSYYVGVSDAMVQYVSVTFSGSATGPRFLVHQNGVILSNGSGATYFPGSTAGSRVTNGVYSGLTGTVLDSIAGGTAVSSTLTLKSTEGVGSSDAIIFQVGNNGATEAARFNTSGFLGVGTSSIDGQVEIGAGPTWSTSNFGLNLAITGAKNNAIGWLDGTGSNPWALSNNSGNFRVSIMPAFGNVASAPTVVSTWATTGFFGVGAATPDRKLHSEIDDATTNATTYPLRLTHTTTGTPATGIGAGLEFEVETSAGNNEVGATIEAVTTDVTGASEDFDLVFKNMAAGSAAAETARILSTGVFVAANEIRASGDTGGAASKNTLTNGSDLTANSTGVGTILFKGTTSRNSSGFIKFYIGTTAYYVPVFSAISG